jgi:glycosyltransferase involved in cell wall biosynthesis
MKNFTIGLTPNVRGVGGMVSFRHKLTAGLTARGYKVTDTIDDPDMDALLVIGGTRDLDALRKIKKRGIPIVQRLNGMNWLHRRKYTGARHFLRAETGNWLLKTIRSRIADKIVYQSEFSKNWWERVYGPTSIPNSTVYNAVDLNQYSPHGAHNRPTDHYRILLVEGSLQGGYETGLETAVQLTQMLKDFHKLDVRLAVAGKVAPAVIRAYAEASIEWLGLVPREDIPRIDRSAHVLYSADLNAACPNSVIEALACGLPVVAFDTGALPELVDEKSGAISPYGGNPWKLEKPDTASLAAKCAEALKSNNLQRENARLRAEKLFGLDKMLDGYLQALEN